MARVVEWLIRLNPPSHQQVQINFATDGFFGAFLINSIRSLTVSNCKVPQRVIRGKHSDQAFQINHRYDFLCYGNDRTIVGLTYFFICPYQGVARLDARAS